MVIFVFLGLIIWAIYEVIQTNTSRKRGLVLSIVSALLLVFLVSTIKFYAYIPCTGFSRVMEHCENGPYWEVTWQMVIAYIGSIFSLGCGAYAVRKATK